MNTFNFPIIRLMVVALLFGWGAVLLGGCGSSPSIRYYQLSSKPVSGDQETAAVGKGLRTIGIGPLNVPSYVDRLQLVTRAGPHELELAEFDRWAEPLEADVTRVLVENLSHLLSREQAAIVSWEGRFPTEFQVQIDIARFDFEKSGEAGLTAHWTIVGRDEPEVLVLKTSRFTQAGQPNDYASMVGAMSRNLESLSQEIGASLKSLLAQ